MSTTAPACPSDRHNTQTQKTSRVVIARCAGVPTPMNMKPGGPGIHVKEIACLRKQRFLEGDGCRGNFEAHLLDVEEEI